ncbi:MAG TPA: terminase small subunit [Thermoanaerobaculia bacterium]|nr:terminase small subunit [Thermoanaerobaculia bacterium]
MAKTHSKRKRAPKTTPALLTRRDLAAAFGVHMLTVTKWERDGMPIAKRGARGRPSLYDEAACRTWKILRDEAATKTSSLEQARIQKELSQAELNRQTAEIRAGNLLQRDDVERVWSQHVAAVRRKLLHLPVTLADRLHRIATLEGPSAVEAQLLEAVEDALNELAGAKPAAAA